MIDPKLNEIPVTHSLSKPQSDSQTEAMPARATQGLSIHDTIAGDSTLSVGARGVDTSGVRAGSGAGAGGTIVTPITDASPAPAIVPGARLNASGEGSIGRADTGLPGTGQTEMSKTALDSSEGPTWEEISARAYVIWCDQGRPDGTSHRDWHRAEEELRRERSVSSRTFRASA